MENSADYKQHQNQWTKLTTRCKLSNDWDNKTKNKSRGIQTLLLKRVPKRSGKKMVQRGLEYLMFPIKCHEKAVCHVKHMEVVWWHDHKSQPKTLDQLLMTWQKLESVWSAQIQTNVWIEWMLFQNTDGYQLKCRNDQHSAMAMWHIWSHISWKQKEHFFKTYFKKKNRVHFNIIESWSVSVICPFGFFSSGAEKTH